jgi:hypothetical protein
MTDPVAEALTAEGVHDGEFDGTNWCCPQHAHDSAAGLPWFVHDHGPDEGRGTACPEYRLNGRAVGACKLRAALARKEPELPPQSPSTTS